MMKHTNTNTHTSGTVTRILTEGDEDGILCEMEIERNRLVSAFNLETGEEMTRRVSQLDFDRAVETLNELVRYYEN